MTTPTTFAVLKTGVYRHETAGGFNSLAEAIDHARAWVQTEPDGHHEFEIVGYDPATHDEVSFGWVRWRTRWWSYSHVQREGNEIVYDTNPDAQPPAT